MRDDVMEQILSDLALPSDESPPNVSRIVMPKTPRLIRPSRPILGTGLGTGRMNPKTEMSRRLIVDDGGIGLGQIENLRAEGRYEDEVDSYLLNKAQAGRDVGGDDFYTFARMQDQRVSSLHQQAPFARVNPMSAAQGAFLGNEAAITVGIEQEVARWVDADHETRPVTVTVGPKDILPPPTVLTTNLRPYAKLLWGTRGYSLSAEIDVGRGSQLTINASSVVLSLALDPSFASTQPWRGVGMLSFQPCVRTSQLTRTRYFTVNANSDTGQIQIPNFAKAVTVYRSDATKAMNINLNDANGSVEIIFSRAANGTTAETQVDPIELIGDTTYLQVFNLSGAGQNAFYVIFDIGL